MDQLQLKDRNRKTVHDVLGLFRDKIVHDVLKPDSYKHKFSQLPNKAYALNPKLLTQLNYPKSQECFIIPTLSGINKIGSESWEPWKIQRKQFTS